MQTANFIESRNEISDTFVNRKHLINYNRASSRDRRPHMSAMATRNYTICSPPSDVRGLLVTKNLEPVSRTADKELL